ncbi:MAG: hypothetical protein JSW71_23075 [Gemmatimonadota bacterium]|nr:MAG: hypothetical protein JSW71_23075 [Gemmatimonadota bacterium]
MPPVRRVLAVGHSRALLVLEWGHVTDRLEQALLRVGSQRFVARFWWLASNAKAEEMLRERP